MREVVETALTYTFNNRVHEEAGFSLPTLNLLEIVQAHRPVVREDVLLAI